jgi:hypothetical protein
VNACETSPCTSPGDGIDGLMAGTCVTVAGSRVAANSGMKRKPRRARNARRGAAAHVAFLVAFVVRSFYDLAIRRCKPGPARWP